MGLPAFGIPTKLMYYYRYEFQIKNVRQAPEDYRASRGGDPERKVLACALPLGIV
jgi:hypothetical protein